MYHFSIHIILCHWPWFIVFINFHAVSSVTPPPAAASAPFGLQVMCSVVTWYSPEVSCENNAEIINGYELRFYNSEVTEQNVTKYVGANRTFYVLTEEDKLAGDKTYVQVSCAIT